MLIVGLTGGAGSGKSTVGRIFAEHGARIVDADVIARDVVERGTDGYEEVLACFGADLVDQNNNLDRRRLAKLVFGDPEARRMLEKIVHPRVRVRVGEELSQMPDDAFVVLVVPLLIESGATGSYECDKVVVVDCDADIAIERMVRDRGWTVEQAQARIDAQVSRAQRNAAADYIIDNDGDPEELRDRVDACIAWLFPFSSIGA